MCAERVDDFGKERGVHKGGRVVVQKGWRFLVKGKGKYRREVKPILAQTQPINISVGNIFHRILKKENSLHFVPFEQRRIIQSFLLFVFGKFRYA